MSEEGERHDENGGIENVVVFVRLRVESELFVAVARRKHNRVSQGIQMSVNGSEKSLTIPWFEFHRRVHLEKPTISLDWGKAEIACLRDEALDPLRPRALPVRDRRSQSER